MPTFLLCLAFSVHEPIKYTKQLVQNITSAMGEKKKIQTSNVIIQGGGKKCKTWKRFSNYNKRPDFGTSSNYGTYLRSTM